MCLVIAAMSGFEQTIVKMRTKIHLEKWVSQAAGGEPDFKSTRQLTVAQVPTAQDSRNRFHQIQLSANRSSWSTCRVAPLFPSIASAAFYRSTLSVSTIKTTK